MKHRLSDIISACNIDLYKAPKNTKVDSLYADVLTLDSRTVTENSIFIATPSLRIEENVSDALSRNCPIILVEEKYNSFFNNYNNTTVLNTDNCYAAASRIASYFYTQKPSNIVYITGTNGKSSTVSLLRQMWTMTGKNAASYGTLGLERNGLFDKALNLPSLTSLDAISFHRMLEYLSLKQITHFACEASSHGLEQFRLDSTKIVAAGFLNLTQDHLDYHLTMENYFLAKSKLFHRVLKKHGHAILNKDSIFFEKLAHIAKTQEQSILTYSQKEKADFYVEKRVIENNSVKLDFVFLNQSYKDIVFFLFGEFQVENLLCAAACAYVTGVLPKDIIATIPHLKSIDGRMEYIGCKNGASIFVDFAHTPDALSKILDATRLYKPKKIHLVFGCGGDRDPKKRRVMGEIALEKADCIYITDDNPRFENAQNIRAEIQTAAPKALNVEGRHNAIKLAISNLQAGEILIVAGKGHEQGQIINGETYPYCDKQEIMKYL